MIKEGQKIVQVMQVCWSFEDAKTKKREIDALVEAMREFDLKEGLVITEEVESEEMMEDKKLSMCRCGSGCLENNHKRESKL